MDTIIILANALAKAATEQILRLDIQYDEKTGYSARCDLGEVSRHSSYVIREDGTISKEQLR